MKKKICSLFFCIGSLALTLRAQGFEQVETFDIKPLEMECSIRVEQLGLYSIHWTVPLLDSITRAKGCLPSDELHCFVYDSSGLIGSYDGLSTPMQHCDFQTKDSVVEVFFRMRKMPYVTYLEDSIETSITVLNVNPFNKSSYRGPDFESVRLSVHSTLNTKLTLLNDTNTVMISYGSRPGLDLDGHPTSGFSYSTVISLDRYYLNLKTGRIASGQSWIEQKGPRKIVRNSDRFILIVPSMKYIDKNNHQFQGSELIRSRRITLRNFDLNDFIAKDKDNHPY